MKIRDAMSVPPATCSAFCSLGAAAYAMESFNVGSLLVLGAEGGLAGIVTDRDIALAIGRGVKPTAPVGNTMSPAPITISEDAELQAAAETMDAHGIHRLPVVDRSGMPVGLISLDDLFVLLVDVAITLQGALRAHRARH